MKNGRRRLWVLAAAAAPAKIDDTLD
jgi:DNA-directed RNA polymerase sigma subunit (sigma70/sigma32)